jgi:hypothetical protein
VYAWCFAARTDLGVLTMHGKSVTVGQSTTDETTYPGIPDHVGPESKLANRFCDPELADQPYREHLDEWAVCEDLEAKSP